MLNMTRLVLTSGAVAIACTNSALFAQTEWREDFENAGGGDPTAGWTCGAEESIDTGGGNHFYHGLVDTWGVNFRTKMDGSNAWVGDKDYRALGVGGLSLVTAGRAQFPNSRRPMSITLVNNNGTPEDANDDYGFFQVTNQQINLNTGRPRFYGFTIPSDYIGDVPPGWTAISFGSESPTGFTWDQVITDVDQIQVNYYNPEFFYIFQFQEFAVDNITLYLQ